MRNYKALLMGGACLGFASYQAMSRDGITDISRHMQARVGDVPGSGLQSVPVQRYAANEDTATDAAPAATNATAPAWAAEATMNPEYAGAEEPAPAAETLATTPDASATEVAAQASTPAPTPAWAAEATMNPDYTAADATPTDAAPAEAPAADAAAAEAPAESASATPAWAAEATMNPDYSADASTSPPAASETPASTAEAPVEQPAPPAGVPAWAAEATMNPDYNASAATASSAAPAASGQGVEACREALNAAIKAGSLLFANGSWDVLPASYRTLDKLAKIAKGCGTGFVLEVGGHTDNVGPSTTNQTISELRAKSVVDYLVHEGVEASKLKAVGYGQERPISTNTTNAGRKLNRRIEFLVTSN